MSELESCRVEQPQYVTGEVDHGRSTKRPRHPDPVRGAGMRSLSGARCFVVATVMLWMSLSCEVLRASDFRTVSAPPKIPTATVQREPIEVSRDLGRASGLAWQPGDRTSTDTLWIAFQGARKVVRIQPPTTSGQVIHPDVYSCGSRETFVPGLLAYDATPRPIDVRYRVWSISSDRLRVSRLVLDAQAGNGPSVRPTGGELSIEPSQRALRTITGFAPSPDHDDDGLPEAFIICRGGGLCSTIEGRRRSDGELIFRFHPRCVPLNIAVAPDGNSLWILADNGPDAPAVLLERELRGSTTLERLRRAARPSERVYSVETKGRPSALAVSGGSIWVVSNEPSGSDQQRSLKSWVTKFNVGSAP